MGKDTLKKSNATEFNLILQHKNINRITMKGNCHQAVEDRFFERTIIYPERRASLHL
jgi:hypothetical protein